MSADDAKRLAKQARKAAKAGSHLEAAQLFEGAGEVQQAVQSYLAAGAPDRAATALTKAEKFAEAAALYDRMRRPLQAAELYEKGGQFKSAADSYNRAAKPYLQAHALLKAREWRAASTIFQKLNLTRRAAEACEVGGDNVTAAGFYLKAYDEELQRQAVDPATSQAWAIVGLAKRSGVLYAKAGQIDEAVGVLERAALYDDIADVFREAGDTARAADYMARSGRLEDAARMLQEAGDAKGAARMRGEICIQKGQTLEAVAHFEKAGDLVRAADLYLSLKDHSSAGRLFEAANEHARAAKVYLDLKDLQRAAAAYEKAGNHREAARLYGEAGNTAKATEMFEKAGAKYEVGLSYFERGLFDQAIRALQGIAPGENEFIKGKKLLGDIFREKGMISLAIKNYQLAVGNSEIGSDNVDTFYQMALCYEKDSSPEQALPIYEKILVADYHYSDVSNRVNQIKRQLSNRPKTPSGSTGSGIGAGVANRPGGAGRFDETVYQAAGVETEAERRYVIESELGRGGMGIVYKARDTMLDRTVALKVLPPALRSHPQALQNFLREAKSAAALNHPNIVTVYDVGEEAGDTYISMEYVQGRTLKELLVEDKRLPYKAALIIAGQICKALNYAHENNVVHRDIKPSNIMWTDKKEVKLMDFGLAKVLKEVTNQTTRVAGTPFYMSPEQTKGGAVDHRTDLYALGVTLFEMLSGDLPFPEGDIAYHHVHTPPPSLRERVPELPKAFDELVLKLMQKNPDDRFQNAQEVFDALKRVASE